MLLCRKRKQSSKKLANTQLATAHAKARVALELKNKYSKDLATTQVCLELAEAYAMKSRKNTKIHKNFSAATEGP